MGEVWLAEDPRAAPPARVALKLLSAAEGDGLERFAREVAILASLDHPGIVRALSGLERHGEQAFYAMELVVGRDLAAVVQAAGPLAPPHAAQVACDLLEALAAAHEAGVVHRDVKPSNVLVDRGGRPRLTDFGLARAADMSRLTATATVLGTPAYMSPEQADGREATPQSDLYAVGALLFELLCGRPPFVAPKPIAVLRMHVEKPPPAVASLAPDVPTALAAAVGRALSKDPAARHADARAMAAALRSAVDPAAALDPKASTLILQEHVARLEAEAPGTLGSTVAEPGAAQASAASPGEVTGEPSGPRASAAPPAHSAAGAAALAQPRPPLPARPGAPPPTSRLAVISLVLGILSYAVCAFPVTGLPAVILGHLAQRRVRLAGGRLLGAGNALAGIYLGYVALALTGVLAAAAYAFVPSRTACRERLAATARELRVGAPRPAGLFAPDGLERGFCPADPTEGYGYLPFTWAPPEDAMVLWCAEHMHGVTREGYEPSFTAGELDTDFATLLDAAKQAYRAGHGGSGD